MLYSKGKSECHIYSTKGKVAHDEMMWDSKKAGRCHHRRLIKSGSICMINSSINCPQSKNEDVKDTCPVDSYSPKDSTVAHSSWA